MQEKSSFKHRISVHINEFSVLLIRLSLVLVTFTILRIVFYLFNTEHFTDMTFLHFLRIMLGGLRFDISAIMFINFLYIFLFLIPFPFKYSKSYRTFLNYLFLITNSVALALNMVDVFYFDYILKRSTVDVFIYAGESNALNLLKLFIIDYWYGILLGLSIIILFIFIIRKAKLSIQIIYDKLFYVLTGSILLLITCFFSVMGMRGTFVRASFPITLGDAGIYVNKPEEIAIVLNTPFSIIKTLEKESLEEKTYFKNEELEKIYSPNHRSNNYNEPEKKNVIIIVMESFSREYIGSLNTDIYKGEYNGYTPFLDSLIKNGKVFIRTFANGKKSIEALPAITASIPSINQSHVTSPYASNKFFGLGTLLKKKGYSTSFFHGSPKGAIGLEAFMRLAGYHDLYSMKEYGKDDHFDGAWGIWDEEFFQFFAEKLNTFKEPFHSVFFSMSSHHPYKIPEKYVNLISEGELPIHKSIQYSDMALKNFFNRVSHESWFNNTLFVITADHTGINNLQKYNSSVGKFAVPLVLFSPSDSTLIGVDSIIAQQIDIMPTVLNYINYDEDFFSFGNDLLNDPVDPFAVNYINDTYQIIYDDYVIHFRDDKLVGFYNYETDHSLNYNLTGKLTKKVTHIENLLKAFIQEYNHRMISDSLFFDR